MFDKAFSNPKRNFFVLIQQIPVRIKHIFWFFQTTAFSDTDSPLAYPSNLLIFPSSVMISD
ncbi:hypothetical protein HanIR_Chr10g0502401 [Helianthus annuus]|nr:hypothetical protein HanIR_Chr10g0502401 [Helianthus annuus]